MPVAKLRSNSTPDAMKSEEANDSLDTFIRQAIGKEPSLSFSRTGDSPVQWIQLLHALDQQEFPGWPLLSPLKVQMQKCDKCSRQFCSPINYRRHIRVHRRSLNVDKESHKNRDLLGVFWDKLSLEQSKEIVSFKDVTLEEVPGSSIIRALMSFIRKPGFCTLPQVYLKAGSALLDIIQAKPSRLPISSPELFSILDDASERTFLCAGTAESMQKFVFDGEAGKIGLEMKNLVACTSFLVEQKLVKAWHADKDAEALRCQKLLVEEEEAAQKRQAELLERKRQKKLRLKEQRAREQVNGEKVDLKEATADTFGSPLSETSSPAVAFESSTDAVHIPTDHVTSLVEPVQFSITADIDAKAQFRFHREHSDLGTYQNVEHRTVQICGHQRVLVFRRQVPKSQRSGRTGFPGGPRDPRAVPTVSANKVWTRKAKSGNDGKILKTRLLKEAINQTDQDKKCEVIIGSIPCIVRQLGNNMAEAQDNNYSIEHAMPKKNNVLENQCGAKRSTVKLWRPVSQHGARGPMQVLINKESEVDVITGQSSDRNLASESCLRSFAMDENDSESRNDSHVLLEESARPEGLLFDCHAARAFLAQRWKEALAGDHVKLVLFPESEPPGCSNVNDD
ncbi:hypothetical protein F0562_026624 [Nyssa sinensis]|uniref:C2H2-type domain-containing protein n=1 Tax=Nyssa sinensis TaxID=561372 RepID=A0A5J5BDG2_9ASTE|nr:hypothetical protein F0562_026624 [Nyssa sinensis]